MRLAHDAGWNWIWSVIVVRQVGHCAVGWILLCSGFYRDPTPLHSARSWL